MINLIFPCLWFDHNAKEAAEFYCSAFDQTKFISENPFVVIFEIEGQKMMCLNGGPKFEKNPSISLYMVFETEEKVDSAWNKLAEHGKVLMPLDKYDWSNKYGWVEDRFGVNWQLAVGNLEDIGQKITPAFMFTEENAGKAEKAIHFYTTIFDHSSIRGILRYSANDPDVEGTIKHAQFKLNDQVFMAMDSSYPHQFQFNEGISMVVECENQQEIDYYWEKLSAVPEAEQCGWLKDQFGISWQIIPAVLSDLVNDPAKSERVINAFLPMKKFDIETLLQAANLSED